MRSFGQHRCGVLAEAILESALKGLTLREKVEFAKSYFEQNGVDPRRPYLNSGSTDDYQSFSPAGGKCVMKTVVTTPAEALTVTDALDIARGIGTRLARAAYWHRGRCNWLGAGSSMSRDSSASRVSSLGADLYDGTSGVALFAGELFGVTGDEELRKIAVGAVNHALDEHDTSRSRLSGLYLGTLGTSVVAARLGHLLGSDDLLEMAQQFARMPASREVGFDLMAGQAGCIVGNLMLHDSLKETECLNRAIEAAERLLAGVQASSQGLSWAAGPPGARNLTGFSHGTAGAAYALLALYEVTAEAEFKRVAEGAMQYERECFDRRARNWPDYRLVPEGPTPRSMRFPYATTWCHGAPGIAISRMRAADMLPDASYRAEALVALETTKEHLRRWLTVGRPNYSLCHGAAGNAEVLLMGIRSGVAVGFESDGLIEATARMGAIAYGPGGNWPCGVGSGGFSPGLMVGLAGIGHFYLRIARGDVPSVLAPLSEPTWGRVRIG
jgi:lantibiotic modifying enzyme